MIDTRFKLEPLLRQHKKTPLALAQASGLSKTTVYNLVNNKAKAVELQTLDKLMAGLERLIGRPVGFGEILEKRPSGKQERLARLLKDAKPFNWAEVEKNLPPPHPGGEGRERGVHAGAGGGPQDQSRAEPSARPEVARAF